MKLFDIKPSMYIDFNKENNNEASKCKVGNHVRISKYKNIFAKGCVPNSSEEVFVIRKVKNTVLWTCVIIHCKEKNLLERFTKKNCQKHIKKSLKM